MKGFQPQLIQLRNPNITVGGVDSITLDTLPGIMFGGITHVLGFLFRARVTPTFTTAPTLYGLQNLVTRVQWNDGTSMRFDGSFNSMRFHEIMDNGGVPILPDPDTNSGTGNPFYFERVLYFGPNKYAGSPTDFVMPAAGMRNGSLNFSFGAANQLSADCSNYSASMEVFAICAPLFGEIRIPSMYERAAYSVNSNDYTIQGRAKYSSVFLQAGSLTVVTPLAAGNVGSVLIDTGSGSLSQVSAQGLSALKAASSTGLGLFSSGAAGEPVSATDDNPKQVNLGTPTALIAADRVVQNLVCSMDEQFITKLTTEAQAGLRIRWTGGLTTALIHSGRILAASPSVKAALAAKALSELRLPQGAVKIKTLSKNVYDGPANEFLPSSVKVG